MNREQRRALERAQRRQKHKPAARASYVDELAALRLINSLQPFTEQEITALSLPPSAALVAISTGKGQEEDFDTLAAVANVAMVRSEEIAENGIRIHGKHTTAEELEQTKQAGREGIALANEAHAALMAMRARYMRVGRWGVDAQARETIPPLLEWHETILRHSTPAEMKDALYEVLDRCKRGIVHRIEVTEERKAA